jgi:hypothetical protein
MCPNWSERKMDISSVSGSTSAMPPEQIRDTAGMMVLKKAIDIQAQNAMQLLQALPQLPSNPPNLGNSVDVKA